MFGITETIRSNSSEISAILASICLISSDTPFIREIRDEASPLSFLDPRNLVIDPVALGLERLSFDQQRSSVFLYLHKTREIDFLTPEGKTPGNLIDVLPEIFYVQHVLFILPNT